jgi:hypothetical protein
MASTVRKYPHTVLHLNGHRVVIPACVGDLEELEELEEIDRAAIDFDRRDADVPSRPECAAPVPGVAAVGVCPPRN